MEFLMVGEGPSGLQYPFTLETFHYMVRVLHVHFKVLFKYLQDKNGKLPDQQHHTPGAYAVRLLPKNKWQMH